MKDTPLWLPVIQLRIAALAIAGAVTFLDGLRMVAKRGEIMSKVSGGMAAVIGLDAEKITQTLKEIGADQVDLANFNSPGWLSYLAPLPRSRLPLAHSRMLVPAWLYH